MTKLLEEAFAEASRLTAAEQEALGAWILEELASEARWDKAFAGSGRALERLAHEALSEHRTGRTKPLEPTSRE